MSKKRGLGKGMGALLSANPRTKPNNTAATTANPATDVADSVTQTPAPVTTQTPLSSASAVTQAPADSPGTQETGAERIRSLPVDRIRRGSYQPRQHFDQTALRELADSLEQQGMIQPVLVRPLADGYEIVAGERRWRAAQLAGMHDIPAIVRELDDQSVAAVSLIENIQRKDLNRGDIDMGHARALLALPRRDQPDTARKIHQKDLSVRATEQWVKGILEGRPVAVAGKPVDPDILSLQQRLGETLGAPVLIKHKAGGRGKLEISYTSLDELDGILAHLEKTET